MEIKGKNETEHLILKYDDNLNTYIDITKDVFFVKDNITYWYVGFSKNNNYYCMSKLKLLVSTNPIKIPFDENNVYINDIKIKPYNILKFDKLGYKIFLGGYRTIFVDKIDVCNDAIRINYICSNIKTADNNVLRYYKDLAKYSADISTTDNSIEKILFNLYRNVKDINEESVLKSYSQESVKQIEFDTAKLIYPFSTNNSQILAINRAFCNNLSVVTGPPGTGKTQVILNLICNAVVNNMKIAVISNNNTAVENIYEKMKEYDLDFILACLGNNKNVENFFTKSDNLESIVENMRQYKIDDDVNEIVDKLKELYNVNKKIINLKHQLFELEQEFKYYKEKHEYVDCSNIVGKYSNFEKNLDLKYYLLSLNKITFLKKLKLKIKYKIRYKDISNINDLIIYLEYEFYKSKIASLKEEIQKSENIIMKNDMDELNQKLKEQSKYILNNYLYQKYKNIEPCSLNQDNYKENFRNFINRYPVILSTTQSLLRNIEYGFMFDLVIIDEASQSDILTSILTMNVAKQMVIVGDSKQLSQIDNQKIYDMSDQLAVIYDIKKCYQYKNNSILQSVLTLPCAIKNTLLCEHYRCDSRIIEFCNKKFYNNSLIVCTSTSKTSPLIIFHTVEGNHARKNPNGSGQYNDREAMEIVEILKSLKEDDVGIITPFRAQADYIKMLIKDDFPNVEVDTIHKYQGRQKKVIILSTVVNDLKIDDDDFITDFVTNSQLLNVAISRAIKKIYLVVSDKVYKSTNNTIAQFIDYIKYYCNDSDKEGKVTSIFDSLYNKQNEALLKSPCNKYVDSYAETIMLNELNKILGDYPDYKVLLHYRLSDLLETYEGFTNEEIRYLKHYKTHVDFVIFDKISHKLVLCIEVDGTKFHDYDKIRIEHDEIKNRALKANNINILRLKTNQSGEILKIRQYL